MECLGKARRRGLMEKVLSAFPLPANLGDFPGVRAAVYSHAGVACDHLDNGSPLSEAHKGPMQAGTWCPQARVRGGSSIREGPWALGQLLAWEPFP